MLSCSVKWKEYSLCVQEVIFYELYRSKMEKSVSQRKKFITLEFRPQGAQGGNTRLKSGLSVLMKGTDSSLRRKKKQFRRWDLGLRNSMFFQNVASDIPQVEESEVAWFVSYCINIILSNCKQMAISFNLWHSCLTRDTSLPATRSLYPLWRALELLIWMEMWNLVFYLCHVEWKWC